MADKQSREFIGQVRNEGEPTEKYVGPKRNPLTIEVEVDVSEAITGLKALQREAKEATKALRGLEGTQNKIHAQLECHGNLKKINLDISETLDNLFQRDDERVIKDISEFTTSELFDELTKRECVETTEIAMSGIYTSTITVDWQGLNKLNNDRHATSS